jgi:tetratricopeptide (TPR) repeat protein
MSQQTQPDKIARLVQYLNHDPRNTVLCVEIGDLYLQSGEPDKAADYFARGAELGGKVARSRLANVRLAQHRFADALDLLKALFDEGEADAALHFNAGLAAFHLGTYREAITHFMMACDKGAAGEAEKYLAYASHYCGDVEAAIAHCQAWLGSGGGAAARAYLALLRFDEGDRASALAAALEALAVNPLEPEARAVLGAMALEEQRFDDAAQAFDEVLAINPDHGRALLGKGLGLLQRQQFAPGLDVLRAAAVRMSGHPGTMVTLGWACLLAGDQEEAETWCRRAIELDRNFAEAHGALAAVLASSGRADAAKQAAATADRLDPKNFGSVYAKAQLLRAQGRTATADELMRRALDTPPVPGAPPLFASLKTLFGAR